MNATNEAHSEPAAGPVERPVRPLVERLEAAAHAWQSNLTVCGDYMPSPAMLREAKAEIERLRETLELQRRSYEREIALEVAAERERCAKACRDRAMKMEAEAERATDDGEHDEATSLRATAWQLVVAEREILGA